ncbi:beta strand repeat-containing protein, partial [Campylobacter magnus]
AQVAASFAAALALQGNTTEDGQNFAAKLGVADNFTASFKDFGALITANEKAEALKNLVTMMNGVNKDSQVDQYTQEITKITDEYQNIKSLQFTTKDDDDLGVDPETGEPNTTSGVNFTGTYNLTDAEKGTIQSSDRITGNPDYLTDTLTVNVIGYNKDDSTKQTFELSNLPTNSSVEKLVINNGAAGVSGLIDDDFQYINVNGTGKFDLELASKAYKDISLNSAATKEGEVGNSISGSATTTADSVKTSAGDDTITLGTINKSFDVGAGKDIVNANLGKDATGNLGAGDDEFKGELDDGAKLNAGAGDDTITVLDAGYQPKNGTPQSKVEIDGGTGTDSLDLTQGVTTDFQGIKSIKGVEKLTVSSAALEKDGTKLMASAVSGQALELTGAHLTLNAKGTSTVDLTKFTNAEGQNVTVRIENVKSGNVNLESTKQGVTALKEKIVLTKDASKVSIKGFEQGNDEIGIAGVTTTSIQLTKDMKGTIAADTLYVTSITGDSSKITTAKDLNAYLDLDGKTKQLGLNNKDTFFILAYDNGIDAKNSTAKVYKATVGSDKKVSTVELMATVNVANKEIINPGTDVKPASDNVVVFDKGADTLDLATDTYNGKTFVDASKVIVNAVNGTLTVSGATSHVENVDAFITTNAGSVKKAASAGATVNTYLGGSEKADGTLASTNTNIDFYKGGTSSVNTADIASGADTLTVLTTGLITLKDATLTNTPIIDLSKVNAQIKINDDLADATNLNEVFVVDTNRAKAAQDTITLNTAVSGGESIILTNATENITANTAFSGADINFNNIFKNAAANDSIKAKAEVDAKATTITLTEAAETISVASGKGHATNALTLTGFDATKDKLDASGIIKTTVGNQGTEWIATPTSKAVAQDNTLYFTTHTGAQTGDVTFLKSIFKDATTGDTAVTNAVVAVKSSDSLTLYKITDGTASSTDFAATVVLMTKGGTTGIDSLEKANADLILA